MLNCGLFSHDAWSTEQAAFDHLVIFTSVNIGYSSLYRWLRCILRLYLPVYVSILNCYIIDQREDFLQVLESYTLVKCLLHDGKEFLVRITKQQWKEWMLIFLAGTNKLIVLNKNEYFDIGWNRLEKLYRDVPHGKDRLHIGRSDLGKRYSTAMFRLRTEAFCVESWFRKKKFSPSIVQGTPLWYKCSSLFW